ncbi:Histidine phosphatase superfamily (branch 1) [Salinimicrobium catena]|uniref:Histidine phosphatase superfamily (Branch 1) n=1 Tax=Salinimicrobium catena TaxID=390640 RepID=A0A1H5L3V0_9FLAO|nr:phosphoglycerate mutase family protein [Salinimicrobium catena]SDL04932.1 Histidine phosphatase superfamily (branch 1) [Salinimicrobium catena]SEE71257.1 Histidine phosphatase superfamily (branch 1) [Salinimicrobium catena]
MTTFLILVFSLFSLGTPSGETTQEAMTTYYFIRHAEKDTSDPQDKDPKLTEIGLERAKKWAEVFKEVEFDLIYSSDFNRTRTTAKIIAESKEKEVDIYDPRKLNDAEFQKRSKGKKVLVVGHSNTNPHFVNLILEENRYKDIDEAESGSLFIVHVFPNGAKASEVLYIN